MLFKFDRDGWKPSVTRSMFSRNHFDLDAIMTKKIVTDFWGKTSVVVSVIQPITVNQYVLTTL